MQKIILITGSTDGVGKQTAKTLAQMGHHIIVHGRNKEKVLKVVDEIKSETGNQDIDYFIADLLSLQDIRHGTTDFLQKYDHLDVLINNAGAVFDKERATTAEGLEKTMTLNLFAPFLLTKLLLPLLEKSTQGRVINTVSASQRMFGESDVNDIEFKQHYSAQKAYSISKRYLIWNTRHLARLLKESGSKVTVNTTHPGAVNTNFISSSDKGLIVNLIYKYIGPLMANSLEVASETGVYLATSDEVSTITGEYFWKKKIEPAKDKGYSLANEQKVWDYCEKVTA